eukprot:10045720-Ditylum_brightwellii.AAC.1
MPSSMPSSEPSSVPSAIPSSMPSSEPIFLSVFMNEYLSVAVTSCCVPIGVTPCDLLDYGLVCECRDNGSYNVCCLDRSGSYGCLPCSLCVNDDDEFGALLTEC